MVDYIIPLTPEPQSFGITLAGQELRLTVRWLDTIEAGWALDIFEPENAAPIVCGIPLVAGCNLLDAYGYLDLGGGLWLDSELPPTLENLGENVQLCFVTENAP